MDCADETILLPPSAKLIRAIRKDDFRYEPAAHTLFAQGRISSRRQNSSGVEDASRSFLPGNGQPR
jgi:hypothetical protein